MKAKVLSSSATLALGIVPATIPQKTHPADESEGSLMHPMLAPAAHATYPRGMSVISAEARGLRAALEAQRPAIDALLFAYSATNPRLIGSVARGDARPGSDIDLLVDLVEDRGNALLRVAGLGEELSDLLGVRVDVVSESLLRDAVSETALRDAVEL